MSRRTDSVAGAATKAAKRRGRRAGATTRIEGELTVVRAAEIRDRLFAGGTVPAAVDLSAVTEIDTAGVQLLLLAKRTADAAGSGFELVAPSAPVTEVLSLLRLARHFDAAASTTAGEATR